MVRSDRIKLLGCDVYYEYQKQEKNEDSFCFLLVHGFLGSTFTFRKLIPLLARRHDVYAIDLVGFGKSEKSRSFEYSYYRYASLLHEFILALELNKVIVVGHSMGGQIALYAAKYFPERLLGLALICSSGYLARSPRYAAFLSSLPIIAPWFVKRWISRYKTEDVLKNTLYDKRLITKEMAQAYRAPLEEPNFPYTLLGLLKHREGDLTKTDLQTIQLPVLLVWGEEDEIVPMRIGLSLAQDLTNSRFSAFPNAGHQVIEEKPEEVFSEIVNWAKEIQS